MKNAAGGWVGHTRSTGKWPEYSGAWAHHAGGRTWHLNSAEESTVFFCLRWPSSVFPGQAIKAHTFTYLYVFICSSQPVSDYRVRIRLSFFSSTTGSGLNWELLSHLGSDYVFVWYFHSLLVLCHKAAWKCHNVSWFSLPLVLFKPGLSGPSRTAPSPSLCLFLSWRGPLGKSSSPRLSIEREEKK